MGRGLVVGLVALALLAVPAGAFGAQRYASPTGAESGSCAQATPCSLTYAVEKAAAGDEVLVGPGAYAVGETIDSGLAMTIRGVPGQSTPLIVGAAKVTPFELDGEVTVAGLAFRATEATGLAASQRGDKLERLDVRVTGESAVAAVLGAEESLTDSLLVAAGKDVDAVVMFGFSAESATLRNDTIVASGESSYGVLAISVGTVALHATNTIAIGETAATGAEYGGTMTSVVFDHSDLQGSKAGERVTSTNAVTAPPVFVDAAAGDYREAAGSPTIDAGANEAANGAVDLLGNPRALPGHLTCAPPPPAITDIGAYELVPIAPPCAPVVVPPPPPGTQLQKATISGSSATFRFDAVTSAASGFECKLDSKPWHACTSPRTYKHLKPGRHTFRVRAFGAGGVDATPVVRKFKIRLPHRHRHHRV
jgi:hypothetical protein